MTYTITNISQAKKNTDRVNIYLNGKFWIGLGKSDLLSLRLVKDQEISDLEKLQIESVSSTGKMIDRAINYLQRRPRSCAEIKDYLVLKKEVSVEEAENIIAILQDRGLLSDEKFAEWYADYKLHSGINGIKKVRAELQQKRVDMKIINTIVEELQQNEDFKSDQLIKIAEYAEKIKKTIHAKDEYELKVKLTKRLMARGFKYDEVKKVIKL